MSSSAIDDDFTQDGYHQLISILIKLKITAIEISQCPLIPTQDPNPYHPYVIYEEDKLAIYQKTLYKVYAYACVEFGKRYFEFKKRFGNHTNSLKFDHELSDVLKHDQVEPEGDSTIDTLLSDLDHVTKVLLIQNPDHITATSCRRQLVQRLTDRASPDEMLKVRRQSLMQELALTTLILSIASHAKSSTLWEHRRWCLIETYLLQDGATLSSARLSQPRRMAPASCASDEEFEFTLNCADIYPRNYFAWRHRMWLLDGLFSLTYEDSKPSLDKEIERLKRFWQSHPRDHSCTHYITYLIESWNTLFRQSIDSKNLFTDSLLTTIQEMILAYPDSETSWLLFRYVFSQSDISGSLLTKPLSTKTLKTLQLIDTKNSETLKSRFLNIVSSEPNPTMTLFAKEIKSENRTACLGILTFYWLALQEQPNSESYEFADWLLKHLKTYPPDSNEWPSRLLTRLSSYLKKMTSVNQFDLS